MKSCRDEAAKSTEEEEEEEEDGGNVTGIWTVYGNSSAAWAKMKRNHTIWSSPGKSFSFTSIPILCEEASERTRSSMVTHISMKPVGYKT
mgnify:CR=1 FL=1